MKNSHKTYRRT